jgi:hypothetical protein
MRLLINRYLTNDVCTISHLYINNLYFCDVLEDKYRGDNLYENKKVYGKTAIPCGIYKVILTKSNRFGIITPEILKVPFFEGIRIHSGNTDKDTDGCLLVGKKLPEINFVKDSRKTFKELMSKLKGQEDIQIEIKLA